VPIKAERNPCVIASTDQAIADSGDPALQAFHAALPGNDRCVTTIDTFDGLLVDYATPDLYINDSLTANSPTWTKVSP
jgi:hypothetical protein